MQAVLAKLPRWACRAKRSQWAILSSRFQRAFPAVQIRQPSLATCAPGIRAVTCAPFGGSPGGQPHHVSGQSKSRLRRGLTESRFLTLWPPRSQVERKPPRQHLQERWRSAVRASRMPTLLGRTRAIKPLLSRLKGDACGRIDVLPFWIEAERLQLIRPTEKFVDKARNTMIARRARAPVACYDCHRNSIQPKSCAPRGSSYRLNVDDARPVAFPRQIEGDDSLNRIRTKASLCRRKA